jgi:predicted phosphodiesterase
MRSRLLCLALAALAAACGGDEAAPKPPPPSPEARLVPPPPGEPPGLPLAGGKLKLPRKPGSLRLAVIGDSGRGHLPQYEVSAQMQAFRKEFEYDLVLMLGDNIYEGSTPEDYRKKFELPYQPLLDAGVKFYAVIGNHDEPRQHLYPLFNTGGRRYYTFKPERKGLANVAGPSVRFFMLDTENLDLTQVLWLRRELAASESEWKIAVFHRPIYTSGRYAAPALRFRRLLEPAFLLHGVSVAFSGHEHFYERTHPQRGIVYFISGGAGSLRRGDIRPTGLTAAGFDEDFHFMLVEIAGDDMYFQAISRAGATVDSGKIERRK